ncbi:hypothetical protein H4R99_003672 [Coemansia sp. RSA 1722]|nr:hypothetical protein LPJ57_007659 [Coemansia sp. RSA 486]KAJ2599536.1 hypothetical protein H4R99_003672 [Coemansia sp. RSA 1722]
MSSPNSISATYQENASLFTNLSPAGNVARLFGPPKLIGSSLDNLVSTQDPSAIAIMPGIAMGGENAASANQATGEQEQLKTQYYLAYDDKDKILWFQVQITPNGDEILTDHGWKEKSEQK